MQSQLVCSGCRSILVYPGRATHVRCALCNTITSVQPPGTETAQLMCGRCRTLMVYARGATRVRCYSCHIVNLTPESNQFAHVKCGKCCTTLMYPHGAPSVKCAICEHITNVNATHRSQSQTVVVENPMTVADSGKLVTNVVVGVTT